MKCQHCHRDFIPDLMGMEPKAIAAYGEEDTFIVHAHCADEIQNQIKEDKTNGILGKILRAMSMCLILFTLNIYADEILDKKDWKKGAVVTFIKTDGGCVFKPFLQIGISDDWDGAPMVLGVTVGDVKIDEDGNVILERVSEAVFIPRGKWKSIKGRICRSPPYNF